jgi:hypothetical protein
MARSGLEHHLVGVGGGYRPSQSQQAYCAMNPSHFKDDGISKTDNLLRIILIYTNHSSVMVSYSSPRWFSC